MASLSYTIQGQLAGNITTTGGTVEVSLSGNLGGPPPPGGGAGVGFPGPAPTPTPGPPASPTVDITKELAGSPVCRE
jgi:hypothetical protein